MLFRSNHERLSALFSEDYPVPKIYNYDGTCLDIEYLHGLDIKHYLIQHNISELQNFIVHLLEGFSKQTVDKDYTEIYNYKLKWIDGRSDLPFTRLELVNRLPKVLPCSTYHGDLTLENIIYSNDKF